jgi:hypothetical protein
MRRRNHSPAVVPVVYGPSGARAAASAISVLSFVRGARETDSPGRVKNTSDQRSNEAWAFGGVLRMGPQETTRSGFGLLENRDLHNSVNIRAQDTSAEDRHRVAQVANGMPGHWLKM